MYESHYGFRERPFSLLPDPMFLYASRRHNAALAALTHAFETEAGVCVLSGAPGTGKTTLLRELMRRLPPGVRVGLLSNSHPSITELLHWILSAFAIPCEGDGRRERSDAFREFLLAERSKGRRVLVMLDEAQNLSPAALEELRLLANLSAADGPSLQLILAGQPGLTALLATSELAPFTQRIVLNETLVALDAEETVEYIWHRVRVAGAAGEIFERAACDAVFRHAGGNPRLINLLCDLCLVHGAIQGAPGITRGIVEAVLRDRAVRGALPEFQALDTLPARPEQAAPDVEETSPRKLLKPKRTHPHMSPLAMSATNAAAAIPEPAATEPAPERPERNVTVTSGVLNVDALQRASASVPEPDTGPNSPAGTVEMKTTTPSHKADVVPLRIAKPRDRSSDRIAGGASPGRSLAGAFAAGLVVAALIISAIFLGVGKQDNAGTDAGKADATATVPAVESPVAESPATNPELTAAEAARLQRERDEAIAAARDLERERDAALAAKRAAIRARDARKASTGRSRPAAKTAKAAPEQASKPATEIAPAQIAPVPVAKPASALPAQPADSVTLPSEQAVTTPDTPPAAPVAAPASPPAKVSGSAPAKEPTQSAQETRGFSANPCKGPSARFLSTCKD